MEAQAPAAESLEALYERLIGALRFVSCVRFRVPRDEADALIHDVFVAYAMRSSEVYDPQAWLVGAVSNASRKYWRNHGREVPLPPESVSWEDDSARATLAAVTDRLTADATLARLDDRARDLLRRFYLDGQSTAAIAEAFSTTPGTIQVLLHTTRKRAQAVYAELMGDTR